MSFKKGLFIFSPRQVSHLVAFVSLFLALGCPTFAKQLETPRFRAEVASLRLILSQQNLTTREIWDLMMKDYISAPRQTYFSVLERELSHLPRKKKEHQISCLRLKDYFIEKKESRISFFQGGCASNPVATFEKSAKAWEIYFYPKGFVTVVGVAAALNGEPVSCQVGLDLKNQLQEFECQNWAQGLAKSFIKFSVLKFQPSRLQDLTATADYYRQKSGDQFIRQLCDDTNPCVQLHSENRSPLVITENRRFRQLPDLKLSNSDEPSPQQLSLTPDTAALKNLEPQAMVGDNNGNKKEGENETQNSFEIGSQNEIQNQQYGQNQAEAQAQAQEQAQSERHPNEGQNDASEQNADFSVSEPTSEISPPDPNYDPRVSTSFNERSGF